MRRHFNLAKDPSDRDVAWNVTANNQQGRSENCELKSHGESPPLTPSLFRCYRVNLTPALSYTCDLEGNKIAP